MSEKRSKRIVERKNALLRERLKSSRRDAGYTQKEFAEKLGVYRLTLQKYEAGDSVPKIRVFVGMVNLLGVTCDYLTGRTRT
jgi:Predicted transcriptional regulator